MCVDSPIWGKEANPEFSQSRSVAAIQSQEWDFLSHKCHTWPTPGHFYFAACFDFIPRPSGQKAQPIIRHRKSWTFNQWTSTDLGRGDMYFDDAKVPAIVFIRTNAHSDPS
ncbi:hypothetical protein Poly41_62750 [Novipirellula artificiosorum]|uniref:Uncharacterized protein n=1 Tax=Novipirellula artificiosorum TaxID=2528016 RepID=A0A5C6D852_9BACT|nr:hypothetical protein Poly41_62750 [Novipirellula artificiosorum]